MAGEGPCSKGSRGGQCPADGPPGSQMAGPCPRGCPPGDLWDPSACGRKAAGPGEPHRRLLGMKPMSSVSLSGWTRRACHHSSSLASITCSTSPKRKLRAWLRKPQSLVLS